ncbi:hypothetical protein SESBI_37455 [Sesbania bispinosa]|nr:hypothetical protein SESBI_37455 [Sesbania bispinosa]
MYKIPYVFLQSSITYSPPFSHLSSVPISSNPPFLCSVFYVIENRIFCCGFDLSDLVLISSNPPPKLRFRSPTIFQREKSTGSPTAFSRRSLDANGRMARLVEFWTDAATDHHRRNSASSVSSSLERFFEMPKS